MDVGRVVSAISTAKVERQAVSIQDSAPDSPKYPWDSGEPSANASTAADVARACGTPIEDWTSRDHECSGMLMEKRTPEELLAASKRVQLHLGEDQIFPSDLVRHASVWRNPQKKVRVRSNAKRDTYSSGKVESDQLEGMDLTLDRESEKALINGCPTDLIREHYMQAPPGYWKKVSGLADADPDASLSDIYDQLQPSTDWHPSDRSKLTW